MLAVSETEKQEYSYQKFLQIFVLGTSWSEVDILWLRWYFLLVLIRQDHLCQEEEMPILPTSELHKQMAINLHAILIPSRGF